MSFNNDSICPRLIDYIAIVGLRQSNRSSRSNAVPELMRRYPPTDHKNGALPNDVVYFCQPDGCWSSCPSRSAVKESTVFVFSLTEKETGRVRYCVCLNMWRPIERRSPAKVIKVSQDRPGSVSSAEMGMVPGVRERQNKRIRPRTHSLTSLLIISHHPFFRGFKDCLSVLRTIIEGFDDRAKKRSNGRESIWNTLLGSTTESVNSVIHHDIVEIETWIFRLLSAPVPVPGITKIELSLLPETVMQPLTFALPDNDRFPLLDFPLHALFDIMGVEFALKLFITVLLEHKVLIQSKNFNILTTSIFSLKALFYPLEYMFPIIPLLPTQMPMSEQLILAPSPFIFGIPANFLSQRKNFKIPDDVWLFDLDKKMFMNKGVNKLMSQSILDNTMSLPPAADYNVLIKHIRQALNSISDQCEPVYNLDDIINNPELYPHRPSRTETSGFNPLIFGNDADSVDISTRVAMVRFFNSPSILGDYSKFTRVLKLFPRPIVAFQMDSFIKSRRTQSEFIKKLAQTQAAEFFGEWSIAPKSSVLSKILSEKYDPCVIGDKAKWFDQTLAVIPFKVFRENGNCTLHLIFNKESNSESDSPTDESGSDSDNISDTSSSNRELTENCSDPMDSGINECQRLTVDINKIYCPPTYLQIPSIQDDSIKDMSTKARLVASTRQYVASDSEEVFIKRKETKKLNTSSKVLPSKPVLPSHHILTNNGSIGSIKSDNGSSTSLSIISDHSDKPSVSEASAPSNMTSMYTAFISETSKKLSGLLGSPQITNRTSLTPDFLKANIGLRPMFNKKSSISRGDLTNKIKEAHSDSRRSSTSSFFFPDKRNTERENQEFIQQVTEEVLTGNIPNILSRYKIKSLAERESYRNLILSRISKNLDKSSHNKETHVKDVVINTEDQFNALVWMCKVLVSGIEASYTKAMSEGYGSVFVLLEMIHTHYIELRRGSTSISVNSLNPSPTESRTGYRHSSPNIDMVASLGIPVHFNGEEYENIVTSTIQRPYGPNLMASETDITGHEESSTFSTTNKVKHILDHHNPHSSPNRPTTLDIKSETSSVLSLCDNDISCVVDYNVETKSSDSKGYRFFNNHLYYTKAPEPPNLSPSPTTRNRSSSRQSSVFSRLLSSPQHNTETRSLPIKGFVSDGQPNSNGHLIQRKLYLYQKLIGAKVRSPIWDNMIFWEDVFYDAVCQDREILGMDQDASDLLDRYNSLDAREKKRLEKNEDRLLGITIHNLIAFMVMMRVESKYIHAKARRMIAKSHIGLDESKSINKLTDSLKCLRGNDIDLMVGLSSHQDVKTFSVYYGTVKGGDLYIAEVYQDCLLLRTVTGIIVERWWLEKFIKCTCKRNVICISRRDNHEIVMTNLYCKNSKDFIEAIQWNSEKFVTIQESGISKFNVMDDATKCSGFLQVDKKGITFSSNDCEWFVELIHIKKCFTRRPDKFIVEILDPNSKALTYRTFKSYSYDQIAYSILTQFSFLSSDRLKPSSLSLNIPSPIKTS